jgi:HAD superfamily hydrolase (TIGR01509 family)
MPFPFPTPLQAIVFDWDGTLADTAEASFRCYLRMFETFNIRFDRETFRRTYSPNWHLTFRALGLPEESWALADERWLAWFAEETCPLVDGASTALDALQREGFLTGIVTSGNGFRVRAELKTHGIDRYIADVVGGDEAGNRKPHPDGLLKCLRHLRVAPAGAVYVGDSPEDVEMARAAGVYSVAIPGGYPNEHTLREAGADLYADNLRQAVDRFVGKRAR